MEVAEFREMLGVPPGSYERGLDFERKVIDPAVLEVNGLSDMGVQIKVQRRHARAPIHAVTVAWWKKEGDEFRAAMQERTRSKVGRMARLRGEVEKTEVIIKLAAE
jgi:plasmid replication initiation protein